MKVGYKDLADFSRSDIAPHNLDLGPFSTVKHPIGAFYNQKSGFLNIKRIFSTTLNGINKIEDLAKSYKKHVYSYY